LGVTWDREGLGWGNIEPQKDHWTWSPTDSLINRVRAQGLQLLGLLAYTAPWAASVPGKTFSPPKDPQDWQNFVEQAVSRYSQPPYSLRYFQVWNEPTSRAGFWTGTSQQWVDLIYLPAARVIHKHNCYVVFGGWPASNTVQELDQVLNYHDAWRVTDIVDIHYAPPSAFGHLINQWVKTGKCRGVWESEIGYTADPAALARNYLLLLDLILRSGWNDPDEFKAFWFTSQGGGANAKLCLSQPGPGGSAVLTEHGTGLKVLSELLGAGSIATLSGIRTVPPFPPLPSDTANMVLGFEVGGNRAVVALLVQRAAAGGPAGITLQLPLRNRVQTAEFVNALGERQSLQVNYRPGLANVRISAAQITSAVRGAWVIGYVVFDGT